MPSIGRGVSDIRYAVRVLARQPAFSAAIVGTLAVAIGANVAIFTIVNALVFRPLPYPAVERLVTVSSTPRAAIRRLGASHADYDDWRARARSFEAMGLAGGRTFVVASGNGVPEVVDGARCTEDLFRVLALPPLVGRVFTAREDRADADPVVVLGQSLWERRFGADRSIVGRVIRLDGRDAAVIGVMPRDFAFPDHADLWVPMAADPRQEDRSTRGYGVIARLRPGATAGAAATEMQAIAGALALEHPATNHEVTALVDSLAGARGPRQLAFAFFVALGAGGFVLLIACANVANLLLARTTSRARELAIRTALGASCIQVARLLLTEVAVLTAPAGVLGLLLARSGRDAIIAMVPSGIPNWMRFDTDWRILLFTVAVSAAAALAATMSPVFRALRRPPVEALKQAGTDWRWGGRRLRGALVATEVALTFVLLVGATLLVRTFFNAANLDPGFQPDGLLTVRLSLPETGYSPERRAATYDLLATRVAALPGIASVGLASHLPLASSGRGIEYEVEGAERGRPLPVALRSAVNEAYFRSMGLPLLAGRGFDAHDDGGRTAVAVLSRAVAQREWPHESPVGKRLRFRTAGALSPWLTVVGVTGDIECWRLEDDGLPWIYVPLRQTPAAAVSLVARSTARPEMVADLIRGEMRKANRDLPIAEVLSFEAVIRRSLWAERLFAGVFEVFGLVALGLALVGIYGIVSYSAVQRTREIGIRAALGADRSSLSLLILRDGSRVALLGVGLGVALAFGVAGVMSRLLYGVAPRDLPTFTAVSLLVFAVSSVAAYVPARRAARMNPLTALRRD